MKRRKTIIWCLAGGAAAGVLLAWKYIQFINREVFTWEVNLF